MKKLLTVITVLFSLSTTAMAQESKILTLDEAIDISLARNPAIAAIHYKEQAAIRERKAAMGLRMPQINITGNYTYLGKDIAINANNLKQDINNKATQIIGSAVQNGIISQQTSALLSDVLGEISSLDWSYPLQKQSFGFIGGEINIPIFLGGKINAAIRIAQIEEQSVKQQTLQTTNSLISELIEQYYALSLATHVVQVRKQVTNGIQEHLNDAIALEEQGMIAHSERLYVEYKMAEAKRELRDAELKLATIKKALNTTLSTDDNFSTATPMFTLNKIEGIDYYKHLAEENNPILHQVELKQKLSKQGMQIQRSQFFPQIVAMGVANIYNNGVTNILPRWAVGVGVSFKLFDGLNRENKYLAAKEVMREVEQISAKAHNDIGVLVEKLYNDLQNYHNRIISIESSIRFAEEYREAKDIAFTEGWVTASDLIDAELNLAKARTERLEAAFNYDVTLAKLLEVAGISRDFTDYIRRNDIQKIE